MTRQQTTALIDDGPQSLPLLHIIRERDVGLFSLIQQVIANVAWALHDGRLPIVDFRDRTCYWTPTGHQGRDTVWEYYFEPVIEGFPAAAIPRDLRAFTDEHFPDQEELGHMVSGRAFVSSHFGDHPALRAKAPAIPFTTGNPDPRLRAETSAIIRAHVRPRGYLTEKVEAFHATHIEGSDVIGVHVRGTDAVSAQERRAYRQGSLNLGTFIREIARLLEACPRAKILVATDAQSSLDKLAAAFGERVIAYPTMRHLAGEPAGKGPTGCIMPAYISDDSAVAAQNGEDAVAEYLLLTRCSHLVHNGASLAVTALLNNPKLPHTNTHVHE